MTQQANTLNSHYFDRHLNAATISADAIKLYSSAFELANNFSAQSDERFNLMPIIAYSSIAVKRLCFITITSSSTALSGLL